MIYAYPDYYGEFKCIADRCRHNCCIGWEIDIDEASLEKYRSAEGGLGDELRERILIDGGPHFELCENDRCPFLNGENLCRLIMEKGEDFLCDICRDHPRVRSYLPGRTEIGLGLSCEEAARLIITRKAPFAVVETGTDEGDEETENIVSGRKELLDIVTDRSIDINDRMKKLQELYEPLPEKSPAQWAEFFLSLERMDEKWTARLEKLGECDAFNVPNTTEFEQLLAYFLYRHVPECYEDFESESKILFAVLSVQIIAALFGKSGGTVEELIDIARAYSAEIEYSDENPQKIYDELMR